MTKGMSQAPNNLLFKKPVVRLTSSGGGGHKSIQSALFEAMKNALIDEISKCASALTEHDSPNLDDLIESLKTAVSKIGPNHALSLEDFSLRVKSLIQHIETEIWSNEKKIKRETSIIEHANFLNQIRSPDIDILTDSVSLGFVGKWLWDFSQRYEYVWIQKILLSLQQFSNFISNAFIYKCINNQLNEKDPSYIIDTQAMGTKAICKAVLDYNKKNNKNVRVKKFLTDMPTLRSIHYFSELKTLSNEEKALLDFYALPPLTPSDDPNSQLHFWQHFCGDTVELIKVGDPNLSLTTLSLEIEKKWASGIRVYQLEHPTHWPIRPAFKMFKRPIDYAFNRQALAADGIALALDKNFNQQQASSLGLNIECEDSPEHAVVKIGESDTVISLMLGSNGGTSLLQYVEEIKEAYKTLSTANRDDLHLFVFCANNDLVQEKIINLLNNDRALPQSLRIYPLGFQGGEIIAKLEARSNAVVTRSGGTATMENLAICCEGKILVHSQANFSEQKLKTLSSREKEKRLLSAIPVWEGGNANYLRRLRPQQTRIVNPQTILEHVELSRSPSISFAI